MPKIGFTVMPQFTPTTFEEWYKPMEAYVNTYNDFQEGYQKLLDNTTQWEKLAKQEGSEEAYATYKAYRDQLEKAASDLATKGWSRERDIPSAMKLRTQYMQDITPISEAYKLSQERAAEQRKLLADDPTLLFDKDLSTAGIDVFLHNPNYRANSYSGNLLTTQVKNAAKNLARAVREDPVTYKKILGDKFIQEVQTRGYSEKEIEDKILTRPDAPEILYNLVEKVMDSSGIKNWADDETVARAYDYANTGLWDAIGEFNTQLHQNPDYTGSGVGSGTIDDNSISIHIKDTYTPTSLSDNQKKMFEGMKIFNDDGSVAERHRNNLTRDHVNFIENTLGIQLGEYKKTIYDFPFSSTKVYSVPDNVWEDQIIPAYKKWYKENKDNPALASLFNSALKKTEYSIPQANTNLYENMKRQILSTVGNESGLLKEIKGYNSETGEFDGGKNVSNKDFQNWDIYDYRISDAGVYLRMYDGDDNELKYVMIPKSISNHLQNAVDIAKRAAEVERDLNNGYTITIDEKGNEVKSKLSPEQQQQLMIIYSTLQQELYKNAMSAFPTYETKKEESKPLKY